MPNNRWLSVVLLRSSASSCTPIETPLFGKLWPDYGSEDERGEFAAFLSGHPDAGDVVPGSGGCRKLRWSRQGGGKRGGVRVIYYNVLEDGSIVLLLIYAKNVHDTIAPNVLRHIVKELKP
ncbi:MAG TPA: transcriptional regulator [Rhodanobacteraceae bacterium]